jgi:membrane protein DedA with SNARE-associated domain
MSTPRFLLYTALLVAGAALVGLVIGLVIKTPPASVASILIMVGLLLIALATLVAWTGEKKKTVKKP